MRSASLVVLIALASAGCTTQAETHAPHSQADSVSLPDSPPPEVVTTQRLRSGETLAHLLAREGLQGAQAHEFAAAFADHAEARRLRPGMEAEFVRKEGELLAVRIPVNPDSIVTLSPTVAGWDSALEVVEVERERLVLEGAIERSMYEAMMRTTSEISLDPADRHRLVDALADRIFAWKVDFSRDIQPGDRFRVVFDREVRPDGSSRSLQVLGAHVEVGGVVSDAYRASDGSYYAWDGSSMRAMFLRAPLEYRRISSAFSTNRLHPITGQRRPHNGMDYAAPTGTPVRATADGVVTRSGWIGGYGNMVEVRHPNGYLTRYAHLNSIASGIRGGIRVAQGQFIGRVGMTGQATGPHLHYEVHLNGSPINPQGLRVQPLEPLEGPGLTEFRALVRDTRRHLDELEGGGGVPLGVVRIARLGQRYVGED